MSFTDWLFEAEGFVNPPKQGQWGVLHILTLVLCVLAIITFYFISKKVNNKERFKKIVIHALVYSILFFEIVSRIVYIVRMYYYNDPLMADYDLIWVLLPRPWCAVACWSLIASIFVKKKFFYNYASLSALLCSVIFFIYPGVGYNNQYIMFSNLYSIVTHALLLTTSITLIMFKWTEFKIDNLWKVLLAFLLTQVYALIEVFVLKIHHDPMYFMPNGDIQAGILGIQWWLYIIGYIALIIIYINSFYLVGDKKGYTRLFNKKF